MEHHFSPPSGLLRHGSAVEFTPILFNPQTLVDKELSSPGYSHIKKFLNDSPATFLAPPAPPPLTIVKQEPPKSSSPPTPTLLQPHNFNLSPTILKLDIIPQARTNSAVLASAPPITLPTADGTRCSSPTKRNLDSLEVDAEINGRQCCEALCEDLKKGFSTTPEVCHDGIKFLLANLNEYVTKFSLNVYNGYPPETKLGCIYLMTGKFKNGHGPGFGKRPTKSDKTAGLQYIRSRIDKSSGLLHVKFQLPDKTGLNDIKLYFCDNPRKNFELQPATEADLRVWFREKKLPEAYYTALCAEGYDNESAFAELSEETLKTLGVAKEGHRKVIMKHVQETQARIADTSTNKKRKLEHPPKLCPTSSTSPLAITNTRNESSEALVALGLCNLANSMHSN